MSFRDRGWKHRFARMGDDAEAAFELFAKKARRGYCRFGLDRPPIKVYELPARIRFTPDFLTTASFIECQGFGRDGTVKMKLDKWGSLHYWHDLHPVELYLWDSHHERECVITLPMFDKLLANASLDAFDGDKPYFAVNADAVFAAAAERSEQAA